MNIRLRNIVGVTLAATVGSFPVAVALAQAPEQPDRPPEEERFDNTAFRSELLRRGMTGLLDHYKRTRPPAPHGIDAQLVRREQLLALFADSSLAEDERNAALDEASSILESLLGGQPSESRKWTWKLELGKDHLFRRAERVATAILYHGWNEASGKSLERAARRAGATFIQLAQEIGEFLDGVEELTSKEYRRIERRNTLEVAGTVRLEAEYFLQWSRFYRELADRPTSEPRRSLLAGIIQFLEVKPGYTEKPHEQTGVQAQSLLLAGMCRRRSGELQKPGQRLVEAARIVEALPDDQRQALGWVYVLSQLELVRLARDAGQFKLAYRFVEHLDEWRKARMPDNFALALALGVQEAAIAVRQAELAEREGKRSEAQELQLRKHQRLVDLLGAHPERHGEVLQAVYARIGPEAAPATLDGLERNALVAGLLGDAARLQSDAGGENANRRQETRRLLERVLQVGLSALADNSAVGRELRPVALFNVAVAEHRLGRPAESVARFIELVREYPAFERRLTALDYAVRIAADWHGQDASGSNRRRLRTFADALTVLDQVRPGSDEAGYWRYFLADALARLGRLDGAAATFARVPPTSEHYPSAVYREIVTLWSHYERERDQGEAAAELQIRLREVIGAARRCEQALTPLLETQRGEEGHADLREFHANAIILAARAHLEPAIAEPSRALDVLADFEQRFSDREGPVGQALRLRIAAHQQLGELDEAGLIVDVFLERQPESAGAVMDQLLRQMTREVRRLHEADRPYADAAAESLSLARKLNVWANQNPLLLGEVRPASFGVRLAGALLLAGDHEQALALMANRARDSDERWAGQDAADPDALYVRAEALYQLGRHSEAEPIFYQLWAGLPEQTPDWWRALLRSLQCHNAIGSDPGRIVSEIRKLRHTWPEMGERTVKKEFERLERACERRMLNGAEARTP